MKKKENNQGKLGVEENFILNKKPFRKKKYPKRKNWALITNLMLKVVELGILIAIWCKLAMIF